MVDDVNGVGRDPIAVMIPFFHNLEYLRQAVQSLVDQSEPDWIGVVVDDASPEVGADVVVAAFADQRLSVVRNEVNLGLGNNFNRCTALAAGHRLLTILHADDLLEPTYLERIRAAHAQHPEVTCVAPMVTVIDDAGQARHTVADTVKRWMWPSPRRVPSLVGEDGLARLLRGVFIYCPAVSYNVDRLPDQLWDARWGQVMDLDLYGRILMDGGSFLLLPERLYRYRRHAAMMTEQNSAGSIVRTSEETAVCRELVDMAASLGWGRAVRAGRWRLAVRLQALMRTAILVLHGQVGVARRLVRLALAR